MAENKAAQNKQKIKLKNVSKFKEVIFTEDGVKYVYPGQEIELTDKKLADSLIKTKKFKKI